MGMVILSALCMAAFAIIFRLFQRAEIPLLPGVTVNYATAFLCGLATMGSVDVASATALLLPASMIGILFVTIFLLVGISAQRSGVARTTLAGRMSLVLTIAGSMMLFHEQPGPVALAGIGVALAGLVLTSVSNGPDGVSRSWSMPLLIFVGSGIVDIGITLVQRRMTTAATAPLFPLLCFAAATCASSAMLALRRQQGALLHVRTWLGGALLGAVNHVSLVALMKALGDGRYGATVVFPLMNILAIMFATAGGIILFRERISGRQWLGLVLCVCSLVMIMSSAT